LDPGAVGRRREPGQRVLGPNPCGTNDQWNAEYLPQRSFWKSRTS